MDLYGTKQQKALLWIVVVSFSIFLLLSSLYLFLYNPRFYDHQYAKNGVYAQFGYDETWTATKELWQYMQFHAEFTSDFYSEQDQLHMIDVRNMLLKVQYIFFAAIMIFLLGLLYYYSFSRESFYFFLYEVFYSTSTLTIFILLMFVTSAFFFDSAFFLFHRFFFSNNYWLMDPAMDKLVLLFPQNFFLNIFLSVLGVTFIFALIIFGLSLYIKKRYL